MGMLEGKTAIIYGGGGGIGRGVAAVFIREGAQVHLVGRTQATLDEAAAETGALTAAFDALDEHAVEAHVAALGRVDISFNLIKRGDVQGTPLVDMSADDLLRATDVGLRSTFITARAAARRMIAQGSGVLLHLNSASGAGSFPGLGSTGPADAAIEAFMRYLAAEVGPSGVRVCGMWTAGVAETLTDAKIRDVSGGGSRAQDALAMIAGMSALRRTPRLADVAEVATFLASDRADGVTGTMVNVTAGLVLR